MPNHRVGLTSVVLVAVLGFADSASAADPVAKCRGAIVKLANQFLLQHAKASATCETRVIIGKLPAPCPDVKTTLIIDKARAKMRSALEKACGGRDKTCGGPEPDIGLDVIGWNIGSCDQTGSTSCFNPIADCGGIATCVGCLGERAVADALALFADRPAVNPGAEPVLAECLAEITGSSAKSFMKVAKKLGACWRTVSDRGSGGSFSCPNRGATLVAGTAKATNAGNICHACGGRNAKCGGDDDLAPAALGFSSTCPAIGSCGGAVQTIRDLANCADCVTHAIMDTAVRRTIPQFATASPCSP